MALVVILHNWKSDILKLVFSITLNDEKKNFFFFTLTSNLESQRRKGKNTLIFKCH